MCPKYILESIPLFVWKLTAQHTGLCATCFLYLSQNNEKNHLKYVALCTLTIQGTEWDIASVFP